VFKFHTENLLLTTNDLTFNPPDYKNAIESGKDFYIQFHQVSIDSDAAVIKSIHHYLEQHDILYLKESITTIVRELINNAIKANLKRLYFKLNKLNIEDINEYRSGMENFKEETFQTKSDEYFQKLVQSKLVVRVHFNTSDEHIHINVINNIPILDAELHKVKARISKAYKYNDISEAFGDVLDDSEGAGLGLIMAMMLYKNSGFPQDLFKIYKKNELTIATLSIPNKITKSESQIKIADEILKEINDIPAFPENIHETQKLCADPEATIKDIARSISRDPGVTSSILKLANSAGYITVKHVETIEDAVKIIGIKGINTLLLAAGVFNIIDSRYTKFETIWKQSHKRAFYAQKIAMQIKLKKISDFAYLGALLADIGRIVLLSLKPELLNNLREIAGKKRMGNTNPIEEIALGISHSSLGRLIGEKWNFNDAIIKTIDYHHRPHMAPKKYLQLIYIVYLADVFMEIENRKTNFEFLNYDVLEYFNITTQESFQYLHNILKTSYSLHDSE
jgi:HD-like signal output (HDOD) protein